MGGLPAHGGAENIRGWVIVILVCGKKDAGKTTYALNLARELRAEGQEVAVLDGDVYRRIHCNQDFSDQGRRKHLMSMAEEAAIIERTGRLCIVAAVAPKREYRDAMRGMWETSRLIYLPGGSLWPGTKYERPGFDE